MLKFVSNDSVYSKYYRGVFILFYTGMRISEICGLTIKDIDIEKCIININHQDPRDSDMQYHIFTTKTNAGTRKIFIEDDVYKAFQSIIDNRVENTEEKMIDGYVGFLYKDKDGMPLVALHWEKYFNRMVARYNDIYRLQIPNITPHVCKHTYCSNMAPLDHFIKHYLGIKKYGRYVDDFFLIHRDKEYLKQCLSRIREFLSSELTSEGCSSKGQPRDQISRGRVEKGHINIVRRTQENFRSVILKYNEKACLHKLYPEERKKLLSSVNSNFGIMRHYNTFNRRVELMFLISPRILFLFGCIQGTEK